MLKMSRQIREISMSKCKHNEGIHVVRTIETGQFILRYCENCSMNVKWTDK